jgi:hypothetical protein
MAFEVNITERMNTDREKNHKESLVALYNKWSGKRSRPSSRKRKSQGLGRNQANKKVFVSSDAYLAVK